MLTINLSDCFARTARPNGQNRCRHGVHGDTTKQPFLYCNRRNHSRSNLIAYLTQTQAEHRLRIALDVNVSAARGSLLGPPDWHLKDRASLCFSMDGKDPGPSEAKMRRGLCRRLGLSAGPCHRDRLLMCPYAKSLPPGQIRFESLDGWEKREGTN